jgi:hypothetical protein
MRPSVDPWSKRGLSLGARLILTSYFAVLVGCDSFTVSGGAPTAAQPRAQSNATTSVGSLGLMGDCGGRLSGGADCQEGVYSCTHLATAGVTANQGWRCLPLCPGDGGDPCPDSYTCQLSAPHDPSSGICVPVPQ